MEEQDVLDNQFNMLETESPTHKDNDVMTPENNSELDAKNIVNEKP